MDQVWAWPSGSMQYHTRDLQVPGSVPSLQQQTDTASSSGILAGSPMNCQREASIFRARCWASVIVFGSIIHHPMFIADTMPTMGNHPARVSGKGSGVWSLGQF